VLFSLSACRHYTQTYFPASHNWAFRKAHPDVAAVLEAFDYGHAVLSRELLAHGPAAASTIEGREYRFITRELLVRPPSLPLDEDALAPAITRLAPEIALMFDWSHMLHRQLYDVLSDVRLPNEARDTEVHRLLSYYRSRRDLAFSALPKGMELMDGQPYSGGFRQACPKFSTLIWSYHWLQMTVYDALLASDAPTIRQQSLDTLRVRFARMYADSAERAPAVMPMTPAIAPRFTTRYPEAAIIFDNMHAMHDVVADILYSPQIPRGEKRRALLAAAARFRDDTTSVVSRADWHEMAQSMGAERMGGVGVPAR
jgi:hypothetical protein